MGFICRSTDAMKNWEDMTPYVSSPATGSGVTIADVTFRQLHADIHNIDTFYALAEWQVAGAYQAGVLKTTDEFKTNTWFVSQLQATLAIETAHSSPYNVLLRGDSYSAPAGESADGFLSRPGQDAGFYFTATTNSNSATCNVQVRRSADAPVWAIVMRRASDGVGIGTSAVQSSAAGWTSYAITWGNSGLTAGTQYYISFEPNFDGIEIRDINLDIGATSQVRPLAMDLDSENSTRLYVTVFDVTAGRMFLWTLNANTLALTNAYSLGLATDAQVTQKLAWAFPHTPHYPGTANFGNYVYVAGLMPSGTFTHLGRSIDAGASFADIGDASWTTERVGGFRPDETLAGATLYVFLNSGTPAMWRTQNAGVIWANLGSNPFNVEHESVSRHWGGSGDFLIGANAAGSVQAAWLSSPYTDSWLDATGPLGQRLPTAADGGGGICSIAWI